MEQIKKLAPEGIEIKSRPQPRRGFALRTPIYFDVYSKDEIIGLGNVFAFIYPLRGRRSASNQGDRIWRTNSEKEEISQEEEGAKTLVFVNRYERSRINRKKCIEHYGTSCSVCGFSFFDYYGKLGEDYIHVHHLGGLANLQGKVKRFDPIADLCTVCPNCHEMLHKVNPPMKIDDLKHIIKSVSARLKPYPFKTDH
jgi:5-methylcytosine-specific restriction protein A